MYVKAALLFLATFASYGVLVFRNNSTPIDLLACVVLALALVGIGFNVQHDGNHGGFSRSKWVNRGAGFTLDLIGASSYFWKDKHNHNHHVYTNIPHEDADIDLGWLARLSDDHRWLWFHRYQQFYLWFLYAFVHLRYLYTDGQRMMFGKKDGLTVKYPSGLDMATLLVGKVIFFTFAFVIPLSFHRWTAVLGGYVTVSMVMGIIFSVVFQLAHTVDVVEHPSHRDGPQRAEWVVHQIRTTANFATRSRFLRVALGGLNFQREHHLFPKISHVHYPALAKVVKEVCDEYKITYCENATVIQALRSHYRFVKQMGMKPRARSLAAQ
jgi:linoleoyl-CoA desaturase